MSSTRKSSKNHIRRRKTRYAGGSNIYVSKRVLCETMKTTSMIPQNGCTEFEIDPAGFASTKGRIIVYRAKCGNNNNFVFKYPVSEKEIAIQSYLAEYGITLPVLEQTLCQFYLGGRYGMVMPIASKTMEDVLYTLPLAKDQQQQIMAYILENASLNNIQTNNNNNNSIFYNANNKGKMQQELHNMKKRGATILEWNTMISTLFPSTIFSKKLVIQPNEIQKSYIITILKSVIYLLHKMHNAGVIHGDAHWRNFMMDDKNKMYVIDFGEATYIKHYKNLRNNIDRRKEIMDRDLFYGLVSWDSIFHKDFENPTNNNILFDLSSICGEDMKKPYPKQFLDKYKRYDKYYALAMTILSSEYEKEVNPFNNEPIYNKWEPQY